MEGRGHAARGRSDSEGSGRSSDILESVGSSPASFPEDGLPRGPPPPIPVNPPPLDAAAPVPVNDAVIIPAEPVNGQPLPPGIGSLQEWSTCIFMAPKFKSQQLTYLEFTQLAHDNLDVLYYVIRCSNRFGREAPEAGKVSHYIAFIRAIGFNPYSRICPLKEEAENREAEG